MINTPTALTISRLVLSPLALPALLGYLLPYNLFWLNIMLAVLFLALSMTDFFDGYIARASDQTSVLGELLDPLADKFLIFSALIGLLVANKIFFYWVIILVGRELYISGLRAIAAERGLLIKVSLLAKLKTAIQILYVTVVILNPYQAEGLIHAFWWNASELMLLMLALILSLISAYDYSKEFILAMQSHERE